MSSRKRGRPSGYTGHRIYVALAERRLTVRWLARQVGQTEFHVSRVLNGHSTITREFVDATCQAFGLPESLLFFVRPMMSDITPIESEVTHAVPA